MAEQRSLDLVSPWTWIGDAFIAQSWWTATVPATKFGRTIGLIKPTPLPDVNLTGKIAIVTGANQGVGYFTSLHLAERGATVILACRSLERGAAAKEKITKALGKQGLKDVDQRLQVRQLDLLDKDSILKFAREFRNDYGKLDLLIENAGIVEPGFTKAGTSITFVTNYVGHFLLTQELYDTIKNTPNARVVCGASVMHNYGKTEWTAALEGKRGESGVLANFFNVYCDSKLAMLMHAQELRRRFEADGVSATAIAYHPGNVNTALYRNIKFPAKFITGVYIPVCFLKPEDGCWTATTAATAPIEDLKKQNNGKLPLFLSPYWQPKIVPGIRGRPGEVMGAFRGAVVAPFAAPAGSSFDQESRKLWDMSPAMVQKAYAPGSSSKTKESNVAPHKASREL